MLYAETYLSSTATTSIFSKYYFVMKKYPRRKRVTNFPRKLSEEHSQRFHSFFAGKIVARKSFPRIFLDFSEQKKNIYIVEKVSASTYKISELNIRLLLSACCMS